MSPNPTVYSTGTVWASKLGTIIKLYGVLNLVLLSQLLLGYFNVISTDFIVIFGGLCYFVVITTQILNILAKKSKRKVVELDVSEDEKLIVEELEKLDIVIASLHTSLRQDRETVTERLLKAIRNPHVDIIAHPTGRILRQREGADLDMEQVFASATDHQVALEINANPDRLDLGGIHAKRALELGCMLTINTDAHSTQHLNFMKFGVGVSRRAWVPPERVLNTWPAERIASWLDERH